MPRQRPSAKFEGLCVRKYENTCNEQFQHQVGDYDYTASAVLPFKPGGYVSDATELRMCGQKMEWRLNGIGDLGLNRKNGHLVIRYQR